MELSPAEEREAAFALTSKIAWPTIALTLASPAAYGGIVWLGLSGLLPLWLCALLLAPISFAHYSIAHESVHGNLASGGLRWINDVAGWVGALGLGQSYPMLRRSHLAHHAHTNSDADPDIFVKGSFWRLFTVWGIACALSLLPLWLARRLRPNPYFDMLNTSEKIQALVTSTAFFLVSVAALFGGMLNEWFWLWFAPTRLATLMLLVFFQWLPHYPFDRTERYLNTRISLWPGGGLILLQQNLHLIHHLWPAVPFYNYPALYRRLRPLLLAKRARIQGLFVGTWGKDMSETERMSLEGAAETLVA